MKIGCRKTCVTREKNRGRTFGWDGRKESPFKMVPRLLGGGYKGGEVKALEGRGKVLGTPRRLCLWKGIVF